MKLNGQKISSANECVIVLPRFNADPIVFKARAVLDMNDFERMCPDPKPPTRRFSDGRVVENLKDEGYLQQVQNQGKMRLSWIVLKSLEATEDLEWETVDLGDPTTWDNFRTEMKDSGFGDIEINRVIAECLNVNALNEDKIEEARSRFLLQALEANG